MNIALSAVVLTRNRRESLRRCLDSLVAQAPPEEGFEIIVIDDGSSDGTGRAVGRLIPDHDHLEYHFLKWGGVAAARNEGLSLARGEVVAFLADDYILPPDYAQRVISFFRSHPEAGVIRSKVLTSARGFFGRVIETYDNANFHRRLLLPKEGTAEGGLFLLKTFFKKLPPEPDAITAGHGLEASGAAAFKKGVFSRVGAFDERLTRGEDTELSDRLGEAGVAIYYDPNLTVRHVRDSSLGQFLASRWASGISKFGYARHVAAVRSGTSGGGADSRNRLMRPRPALAKAAYEVLFRPLFCVRQAGSLVSGFFFYPFLLLFDIAYESGFLWAAWRSRLSAAKIRRARAR